MYKTYYILGILFACMCVFLIIDSIITNSMPVEIFTTASFAIMCFSLGYLHPQLQKKDERIEFIRQKAMFYSFMALAIYFIVLVLLLTFNIVELTALQVLTILIFLMMATIFLMMVILSKIY